jgi:hypothetical protein
VQHGRNMAIDPNNLLQGAGVLQCLVASQHLKRNVKEKSDAPAEA